MMPWTMDDGRMMDGSADDLDPELNVTSNLDVNQGQTQPYYSAHSESFGIPVE
jgi:hypothetical protein